MKIFFLLPSCQETPALVGMLLETVGDCRRILQRFKLLLDPSQFCSMTFLPLDVVYCRPLKPLVRLPSLSLEAEDFAVDAGYILCRRKGDEEKEE